MNFLLQTDLRHLAVLGEPRTVCGRATNGVILKFEGETGVDWPFDARRLRYTTVRADVTCPTCLEHGARVPVSDIEIADDEWQGTFPEEDPRSRLHKAITLNGVQFHLTAFRVKMEDSTHVVNLREPVADPPSGVGLQVVDHYEHRAEFEEYAAAASPNGPFETIEINGASYVVFGEMACS